MTNKNTIIGLAFLFVAFLSAGFMFGFFIFNNEKNKDISDVYHTKTTDNQVLEKGSYNTSNTDAFRKAIKYHNLEFCDDVVNDKSRLACQSTVSDLIKTHEKKIQSYMDICEEMTAEKSKQHCIYSVQEYAKKPLPVVFED